MITVMPQGEEGRGAAARTAGGRAPGPGGPLLPGRAVLGAAAQHAAPHRIHLRPPGPRLSLAPHLAADHVLGAHSSAED